MAESIASGIRETGDIEVKVVDIENIPLGELEEQIVLSKLHSYDNDEGRKTIEKMVALADLTRTGFMSGDISTVMSPRTVLTWAENAEIFHDLGFAFRVTFLNKCDEMERSIVAEYYQRCFDADLPESSVTSAVVN